jgi:predicted RND superfamily exporter protein
MDALVEIIKAIAAVGVIVVLTLLIPILFMFIFMIATGIDQRMDR